MTDFFKMMEGETQSQYDIRVSKEGLKRGMTWQEIADVINKETNRKRDESTYRRHYQRAYRDGFKDGASSVRNEAPIVEDVEKPSEKESDVFDKIIDARIALKKERAKMRDETTQVNAYIRRLAREETIKEVAIDAAKEVAKIKPLCPPAPRYEAGNGAAILEISDWHLGLDFENYWNKYNIEECRRRVELLTGKVIEKCLKNEVKDLYVANLSDLIAGRIHLQIRLESRIDVITQTMLAAEILSNMLDEFSKYFVVHYYDCLDNHSRIEPNKKDSMDLESLARIIPWYLKERIGDRVEINENEFGPDIITFSVKGHDIIGVHGDKDKPINVIQKLSCMTQKHYDMVLTAHLHHFSADESTETVVMSNGSLMGTDPYAVDLRMTSRASQNLIIVTEENVTDSICRIVLN